MKIEYRRLSVATLTLFVCLLVAPVAPAAGVVRDHDRSFDVRESVAQSISRTITKLKKVVRGITTFDDVPSPPKP
jgi:cytochrome c556